MQTVVIQKCFIMKDGAFLALRRSKTDDRRPLQWDLVGGRLDEKEQFEAGLLREIDEECGLEVSDVRPVYFQTDVMRWKDGKSGEQQQENVLRAFYVADYAAGDVALSYEHDEYQWMTFEVAFEQFEYGLHKQVMKHIVENGLL